MTGDGAAPLLELRALSMAYAAPVLREVSLSLARGEVRVLAGENGAGKSTLSNIVSGLARPLSGSMRLDGQPYAPASRRAAEQAGVRIVLQELNLVNTLSVAENLFLRRLPRRFGMVDYPALHAAARTCMERIGLDLDPATPVARLGVGQRQMIEIAANLQDDCKLLILDEPSAMLSAREVDLLFAQIARLKAAGTAIIYISHRLDEMRRIADSVSVLRDGRVVATEAVAAIAPADVVRLMVGREIGARLERPALSPEARAAASVLQVEHLECGAGVRDVSFEARGGEIFGIAGLVGAGRTETLRAIYGADRRSGGRILLNGRECAIASPADAVACGIGMVSEDRKEEGLLLPQPIRVNTTLADIGRLASRGWLRPGREAEASARIGQRMALRAASPEQAVGTLSGGNQQKVAIGRWLHRPCQVLLLDEPTRGIDVAAKFDIYGLLGELAAQGKVLVLVSSELSELLLLCDRIGVMSGGRLVRTFTRAEASEQAIMDAAFSAFVGSPALSDLDSAHPTHPLPVRAS